MDRYVRVELPDKEQTDIQDNEVRVMAAGKMRSYITYATTLLTEKGHSGVVLKAMGRAINKTVTIAEIIKRRISGLHQNTQIGSIDITDTWEPLEEGLSRLETIRHVSVITITLSTDEMDVTLPGYQAPLSEDQVKPLQESAAPRKMRDAGAASFRGRRGGGNPEGEVERSYGGGVEGVPQGMPAYGPGGSEVRHQGYAPPMPSYGVPEGQQGGRGMRGGRGGRYGARGSLGGIRGRGQMMVDPSMVPPPPPTQRIYVGPMQPPPPPMNM